jgi:NAD(P)-dependent dehydrogenase (short-subunit alcohol dehydrogenase family)
VSTLLQNRVALITGASRGIGQAVARRFAQEGAQVICVARTQGALEELDDLISAQGGSAILAPLDITQPGSIEQLAQAVAARFGRLDILVGNAATLGGELTPVGDLEINFFEKMFALNVTANWRLIHSFAPLLRLSPAGRALFVTDPVGQANIPFWGAYAASKVALEKLVLTWAAEIAAITNIKANLIAPCPVATKLRAQAFPGEDKGALRQPDQITDPFVTLAQACSQEHGQTIPIA